jgi:hypothetical protein
MRSATCLYPSEGFGVLRAIFSLNEIWHLLSMLLMWKNYKEEKPEREGIYLICSPSANPPYRDAAYFYPNHGWSRTAHMLESMIEYWTEYPQCPNSK